VHPTLTRSNLLISPGINANDSILRQLVQAMNRNNEVCKETNKVRQAEYKWKKDVDEIKKDRTKDLHPSIKMMIKNASVIKRDKAGDMGENFLCLYNSKHMAALTSSFTSCLRMQSWKTLFLLKEYRRTCGLGSSCEYKNWH
jgi:hypothetical protein